MQAVKLEDLKLSIVHNHIVVSYQEDIIGIITPDHDGCTLIAYNQPGYSQHDTLEDALRRLAQPKQ